MCLLDKMHDGAPGVIGLVVLVFVCVCVFVCFKTDVCRCVPYVFFRE